MFKGFYNLTSGMLSQERKLNVIANNLINVSTAGYKSDQYVASTFDQVMINRLGNKDKSGAEEIGEESYILASSEIDTNYDQGIPEETNLTMDFAIDGDGFFAIQAEDGTLLYTRNGGFSLDEEGYLCLAGQGRVLDPEGEPIQLITDKVRGDESGVIYSGNIALGQIGVFSFPDNKQLERNAQGFFLPNGQQAEWNPAARLYWGHVERSNVDLVREMSQMLTTQRALQSASQVSKMYDQLMTKAATDLGRL